MNTLSIIAILVLFIYFTVGIYALRIDISNNMNRIFFLECLSLSIWVLTAVIIYSSASRDEVLLWYKISSFGFGLYYALILHLYLLFTRSVLSRMKIIILYTPALLIIAATWFSYTLFQDFIYADGEWKFIPAFSHTGFYAYLIYYFSYVLITIKLLYNWHRHSESKKEKIQSRIISLSYLFTVILCTTTDFILPGYSWYKLPALAPLLLVINTSAIFYVLQKYRFLSPAEDIFGSDLLFPYKDMALLVDKKIKIITSNRAFCEYFVCEKDEIAGRFLHEFFITDELIADNIKQVSNGEIENCSGRIRYKTGSDSVLFMVGCSRVTDRFNDYLGTLIVIRDVNDQNITENNSAKEMKDTASLLTKTDKKWGIDLTGRPMRYAPWPDDGTGRYRIPEQIEINEIYNIPGIAVEETILYFEECGGDTDLLISMLNENMRDWKFKTSWEMLLDKSIWYSHEYYFYFIMFTKRIIGRYNFHFGEHSDNQLSVYHKIYEKGFMEYVPYGKDSSGRDIQDVTTNNVLVLLMYLEQIELIETDDLILFTNSVIPANYNVDRNFYNNEAIWCSLEFIEFGFEFLKIIGNGSSFLIKASRYSTLNQIRIGKLIFLVPERITIKKLKLAISKVNNIHDHSLVMERGYARILITNKPSFNLKKYSKYLKSSIRNDAAIYAGALSGVFMMSQNIKMSPSLTIRYNEDNMRINISIEYRWDSLDYSFLLKISAAMAFGLIAAYFSYYTGFIFYTSIIIVLCSAIVYLYENKKTITRKLEDHLVVSNQQLEEYEKISAELIEEHNTLEQKVEERTSELAMANKKLNELDRLKSEFFANISHEIRTPLTLMITPVESMLYSNDRLPDKRFFESIYSNGLRLLGLINNLLDFSRLDAGKSELSIQKINIVYLIKNYISAVHSICEVKKIGISFINDIGELYIYADSDKLDKIIANLFSNAIKFTQDGGLIAISLVKETINDKEVCTIKVSDTGIGIPAEKLNSIFDRFSQVDSGSNRKYEGTGIGLALVYDYVKLHNGSINVESRYYADYPDNHGSEFTIQIPAGKEYYDEKNYIKHIGSETQTLSSFKYLHMDQTYSDINKHENKEPDELENRDPGLSKESRSVILIVEDNHDMHNLLSDILGDQYIVIKAYNGREALSLLESEDNLPDLILSDVMMPEMDGYEFTRCIRKDPRFEGIPVILLTARAEMEMKLDGFDKGATDYIIKPFNSMELIARVKSQIELKALRDRLIRTNKQLYSTLSHGDRANNQISDASEKKLKQVLNFINENFTADITRDGIAAAVDMNPDNLSRVFNKITGKRIDAYINELRINKAKELLAETDKSVITIAMDTGFDNLRTFNRLFRESATMTPKEYRAKNKPVVSISGVE